MLRASSRNPDDPFSNPMRQGPSREVMLMSNQYLERCEGPIRGLRLPLVAWKRLQDESITTLNQLQAGADRLEQLVGIGPKLAQVIRDELGHMAVAEEQPSDKA
jgi:hypothetical protein